MNRTLRLMWRTPPLSMNQRLHWRRRAEITRDVRAAAHLGFESFHHCDRVSVSLLWVVKDNRRRDVDNLSPTLKALCDGLVDAGVVDDDTEHFMVKHMPRIVVDPFQTPHMEFTVAEVTP